MSDSGREDASAAVVKQPSEAAPSGERVPPVRGWFVVASDPKDPKDILFQLTSSATTPIPQEQLMLMDEISRTLSVLRMLYEKDDTKFFSLHRRLLALARAGLVGVTAQPIAARRALQELRDDVTAMEAGNVKNHYMKSLGKRSVILGTLAFLVAGVLDRYGIQPAISSFFCLWGACMAGVWLSFGARKPQLSFEELHIPEKDRLEPFVRLVFAGLLTTILGLAFSLELIVVKLGTKTTAQVTADPQVAILIGLLCGFSEQILSIKVSQQATRFLGALPSGETTQTTAK